MGGGECGPPGISFTSFYGDLFEAFRANNRPAFSLCVRPLSIISDTTAALRLSVVRGNVLPLAARALLPLTQLTGDSRTGDFTATRRRRDDVPKSTTKKKKNTPRVKEI